MLSRQYRVRFYAFCIWFLGALFFFSEYVLRVSPEVMYPALMDKYAASAAAMGALSSFFYYPYILMQLPVGVITDKFGPRKVMVMSMLLTGVACILFAFAPSISWAAFARAIIGFCAAFAFVGTLRIAISWFSLKQFSLLVGLTQGAGMLGAACGSAPLRLYLSYTGIEGAMLSFAGFFALLACLMFFLLRRSLATPAQFINKNLNIYASVKAIIHNKALWINGLYIGCLYGPTVILAESWGVSFTEAFRGLSVDKAALLVSLIFIGLLIGCPLTGLLASVVSYRCLMRISAIGCLVFSLLIIYQPGISFILLTMCYFCYGLFNSGIIASYSKSVTLVKTEISGIALALTNMASILIGAVMVQIVGTLLSSGDKHVMAIYDVARYHQIFTLIPIAFILCILLTLLMRKDALKQMIC